MERNDWFDPPAARALTRAAEPTPPVPDPTALLESRVSGRPIEDVLFVDPSIALQRTVQAVLRPLASVQCCSRFEDACSRLISRPPDLLVTGVRLHAHNGLHLVYLAARNPRTRSIVHLTANDFGLAAEVEAARGFVVREPWLAITLQALVLATMPPGEARDATTRARRRGRLRGHGYAEAQPDEVRKFASGNHRRSELGLKIASRHH